MKMKHLLSTGLLIHASCATAWVLDESISIPPNNAMSASEPIQADLFESPPSSIELGDLLPTPDLSHQMVSQAKLPYLEKKISSLTPKDIANKRYNAALQKLELEQYGEAEKIFIDILKDYPPHTLSRVQLSKLAILHNDYQKAEKWLTDHPDYFSNHPAYLQTLALIYERTGKKQEALKILEQVPTEHRKNVAFYSLLASLYQQTGNHVLAQRYYNGLLNREPNNMTWLLGLSISLDSGGEKKMALSYYKKILEQGGLDPKVLSFVKVRFDQLSKK